MNGERLRHCIEKIMKFQEYFGSVLWYNFWDILHWKKKTTTSKQTKKKETIIESNPTYTRIRP